MGTEGNRRLAAVMFTDVVGFSKRMSTAETVTVGLIKDYEGLIRLRVGKRDGRLVKTIGDGTLSEFPSAVNALACAVEVLLNLDQANKSRLEDKKLQIRVGLHLGDVMEQPGGDILGDAVNIAARLEPQAPPNGIAMSEEVFHAVRGKLPLQPKYVGARTLKNIEQPVVVYTLEPLAKKHFSYALALEALALAAALWGALWVFRQGYVHYFPRHSAPTLGVLAWEGPPETLARTEPLVVELYLQLPKFLDSFRVLSSSEAQGALASKALDLAVAGSIVGTEDGQSLVEVSLVRTSGAARLEEAKALKTLGRFPLEPGKGRTVLLPILGEIQTALEEIH